MESGKIKISTVHSYKGWSIHTEIFIVDKNISNPDLIFTAITRAYKNLIIINLGNDKFADFFEANIKSRDQN